MAEAQSTEQQGYGFAWAAGRRRSPQWVINVAGGYGAFLFDGTEAEAEEMRAHKANWEHAIAQKRPASVTDIPNPSGCWNHRGYVHWGWYGARRQKLKKPYPVRYSCECGGCSGDH